MARSPLSDWPRGLKAVLVAAVVVGGTCLLMSWESRSYYSRGYRTPDLAAGRTVYVRQRSDWGYVTAAEKAVIDRWMFAAVGLLTFACGLAVYGDYRFGQGLTPRT